MNAGPGEARIYFLTRGFRPFEIEGNAKIIKRLKGKGATRNQTKTAPCSDICAGVPLPARIPDTGPGFGFRLRVWGSRVPVRAPEFDLAAPDSVTGSEFRAPEFGLRLASSIYPPRIRLPAPSLGLPSSVCGPRVRSSCPLRLRSVIGLKKKKRTSILSEI